MAPSERDDGSRGGGLRAGALFILPVLCCALPLLIAAGAFGVAAGWLLGNLWMIGAAVLLVVGVLLWRGRRRPATKPPRMPGSNGRYGSSRLDPGPGYRADDGGQQSSSRCGGAT
ncbi:MAG: hypothetical protein GEU93_12875 [Propionibacteriales bacterium]|nr:hypothetical protein [Propionibacteriales bacterium]